MTSLASVLWVGLDTATFRAASSRTTPAQGGSEGSVRDAAVTESGGVGIRDLPGEPSEAIIGSHFRKKMATSETDRLSDSGEMIQYRNWLVAADQKSSEAYDKAVITLAGGALGLSLTFLKDIVKAPHPEFLWLLGASWGCLTLSLTCILISMLSSQWALRKAIKQVDQGLLPAARVGGRFAVMTEVLNIASAATLVIGVLLLAGFSISNFRS